MTAACYIARLEAPSTQDTCVQCENVGAIFFPAPVTCCQYPMFQHFLFKNKITGVAELVSRSWCRGACVAPRMENNTYAPTSSHRTDIFAWPHKWAHVCLSRHDELDEAESRREITSDSGGADGTPTLLLFHTFNYWGGGEKFQSRHWQWNHRRALHFCLGAARSAASTHQRWTSQTAPGF